MTIIQQLGVASSVNPYDQLPIWSTTDGVTRRMPVSVLDTRYGLPATITAGLYRFLGISATPPIKRTNGDGLQAGDIYTDTGVPPLTYSWSGSAWVPIQGGVAASILTAILAQADSAAAARDATVLSTAEAYALALFGSGGGSGGGGAGSGTFQQDGAGMVQRTFLQKLKERISTLDASGTLIGVTEDATAAFAAVDVLVGTINVPRGIHKITSSITLKGTYAFEQGAIIQPAAGVVITFNYATIIAGDKQQIFDLSLATNTVVLKGTLTNDYHSVCWNGTDPTGATVTGAKFQQMHDQQITRVLLVPSTLPNQYYDMTGTQFVHAGVNIKSNCTYFNTNLAISNPAKLKWTADLGAGARAWSIMSSSVTYPGGTSDPRAQSITYLYGLIWEGPNATVAPSRTPAVNMDGVFIGTGGNCKVNMKGCSSQRFRANYTGWCQDGHSIFENLSSLYGWVDWQFIGTGGDWQWKQLYCDNTQFATFYAPRNGAMGQNAQIEYFYAGGIPYAFYQTNVLDPRGATQNTNAMTIGGRFDDINVETMGNAFMCFEPTDSAITLSKFINCRWSTPGNPNDPRATITADTIDYAIKLGSFIGVTFTAGQDGPGVGVWGCGPSGFLKTYGACEARFIGYRLNSLNTTTLLTCGGTNAALFMPVPYKPIVASFYATSSALTFTYTMTVAEATSLYYIAPSIVQVTTVNGVIVPAMVYVSGATVTVTISNSTPFPSGYGGYFELKLFPGAALEA